MQRVSRLATGALLLIFLLLVYACARNLPRSFEHRIDAHGYYDIVLRDLGLSLGALALGRLAQQFEKT